MAMDKDYTFKKGKRKTKGDSTTADGCEGCKHRMSVDGQWCYMFMESPPKLPCGQHDMFKELREENGKEWIRRFSGARK